MRQNAHEVEIHTVDQQLLVHKQTGLSKVVLLERRFIRLHDQVQCSREIDRLLALESRQDVLEFGRELRTEIQHVLILEDFEREMGRVYVKILAIRRLMVYYEVQVERYDVAGYLQSMIKMVPLIPLIENVLVAPPQIVEPYLRKTSSVIFSHDSRPEISLLDGSKIVILERVLS